MSRIPYSTYSQFGFTLLIIPVNMVNIGIRNWFESSIDLGQMEITFSWCQLHML